MNDTAQKTILIVDDSKVIRMIASRCVNALNFKSIEAENGQKALEMFKRHLPDGVLLDWNMPVMNGMEFLEALRKTREGKDTPVIICTTENDLAHIQEAMSKGADEYIMKPFDPEIVLGKLQRVGLL